MKTILLLRALAASCLTAVAQTAPMPGAPVRPEWIDPLRFRQYDINKDGKLDLQEQEAERAARPADEARRRAQVEQFRKTMAEQKRQADLNRFDANKDGVLDATEQKARDQYYETVRGQFIKQYDKNRNGKIDPEEIRPSVPVQPSR